MARRLQEFLDPNAPSTYGMCTSIYAQNNIELYLRAGELFRVLALLTLMGIIADLKEVKCCVKCG